MSDLDITPEMIGLLVEMSKLDPTQDETAWPEDMQHIRIVGCPDMRQCEIKYQFGVLYFRERGTPDSHFVTIGLEQIMRRIWVSIMKANDGLDPKEAFKSGLRTLPGFNYMELADELIVTPEQLERYNA